MKPVVLAPDQFYNCPICNHLCVEGEIDALGTFLQKQGVCQYFLCTNLAEPPYHYYSHLVDKADPYKIAFQNFSTKVDTKYYMCSLNLISQKTIIKTGLEINPLEVNQVIIPDFPYLFYFSKKIQTIITFS